MFEHILIPLDGSLLSEAAIAPAKQIVKANGKITLISVMELPMHWEYGLAPTAVFEEAHKVTEKLIPHAKAYLEEIAAVLRTEGFQVETFAQYGEPATIIVDTAAAQHVNAIAMSTHGRSGFSRWLFGSVTGKVLSTAPCPVFVIHPKHDAKPEEASPVKLSHLFIPLDGSTLAEAAVQEARRLVTPETHITLLTVIPKPGLALYDFELTSALTPTYETRLAELMVRARNYLEYIATQLELDGITVSSVAEFGDDPATTIVATAKAVQADAIIISTHGRSGISRWVFGSITGSVLSIAECPVLVVPSRQSERNLSDQASEMNYG